MPLWNDECSLSIKEKNSALRNLRNKLNLDKRKIALARKIINKAKRNTWRQFVLLFEERDERHVWDMFKKMGGRRITNKIPVLADRGNLAITDTEKVNLLELSVCQCSQWKSPKS